MNHHLLTVTTLHVEVPRILDKNEFEAALEPGRYGREEWGDIDPGISIAPDELQETVNRAEAPEPIIDFLAEVLALPLVTKPDEYYFYAGCNVCEKSAP